MTRVTKYAIFLLAALVGVSLWAAGNDIVGSWECEALASNGAMGFVMTITENGGKLAGTAQGEGGPITLENVRFEDSVLRFRATMDFQPYEVEMKLSGDSLSGKWSGGGDSGTVKGVRKS